MAIRIQRAGWRAAWAVIKYLRAWSSRTDTIVALLESATRSHRPLEDVLEALDAAKRPLAASLESEALALKVLNLLLCRYHLQTRSDVVLSRPVGIILDPMNTCQMACPGCVHSHSAKGLFDWRPGRMSVDTAEALFHRFGPYALQASFCNYGEPTLNPDTPRMIRIAKSYRLRTTMSSNLAHPRFNAEEWVACGLDFLIASIDGVTPEVYSRFRRNGNHELAMRNMRALVEAKRRLKLHTPVIHWQFLAFEHNKHEIPAAIEVAAKIGVNQLSVARPFDVTWDDPSIRVAEDVVPELHRFDGLSERWMAENERAFPLRDSRIREAFDAGFGSAVSSEAGSAGHTCSWLYKNLSVDANGRVFPCCCAPRPDADLEFGRLDTTPDPFNSDKYRMARRHFTGAPAGAEASYCAKCTWPKETAQIDRDEIRHYLRGIGAFSHDTIRRLSSF
jgi:MoaA/NifB/PqqE/SkfB family radical SAM enzyme